MKQYRSSIMPISKGPLHLLGDDMREIFEKRFISSYFLLFISRQKSAGSMQYLTSAGFLCSGNPVITVLSLLKCRIISSSSSLLIKTSRKTENHRLFLFGPKWLSIWPKLISLWPKWYDRFGQKRSLRPMLPWPK